MANENSFVSYDLEVSEVVPGTRSETARFQDRIKKAMVDATRSLRLTRNARPKNTTWLSKWKKEKNTEVGLTEGTSVGTAEKKRGKAFVSCAHLESRTSTWESKLSIMKIGIKADLCDLKKKKEQQKQEEDTKKQEGGGGVGGGVGGGGGGGVVVLLPGGSGFSLLF